MPRARSRPAPVSADPGNDRLSGGCSGIRYRGLLRAACLFPPHDIAGQVGQVAREAGRSSAPVRKRTREDPPPSAPHHLTVPPAAVGRAFALPPLSGGMSEAIPPDRPGRGVSQIFVVNGLLTISGEIRAPELWSAPMILNAITEKLKRQSKDDFKGRHFEAWLIVQAVAWYLRYPLSYRDLEEMFRERGFEVDHSTINRWVLAYAPMIEKRLRQFRRPHCGSVRIDETYVKIRGKWRYLYRAIDKHGNPVDFLLTAKRDLDAAKRFFRKMLKDEPLLSPGKIGTDGANTFPSTIKAAVDDGLLHPDPVHYVTKHLQQGIESDHFRVKKNMPKIGGFQSFNTARRTIAGFEAMLWLRKGFGFSGSWNVNDQNDLLAYLFGLQKVNKA